MAEKLEIKCLKNGQVATTTVDSLMTMADVCKVMQVSRMTIHRWVRSGAFPAPAKIGRSIRWMPGDIAAHFRGLE